MIPNKIITIFLSIFIVAATIYLALLGRNSLKSFDYIGVTPDQNHSITISGEGSVTAIPDIARIELGFNVERKTVAEAQKENSNKMNQLLDKLKNEFKIDTKDITTTNYNIYPQYDYTDNKQLLRGYQVAQNVSVKVRNIDQVSKILETSGTIGLNQIGGLSFEIDEPEKLKQEAREKALKQAKAKAESLANIAGVKLGRIISFSESDTGSQPPIFRSLKADSMGGGVVAPEVQPGSSEIKIITTVEYEIL